MNVPLMATCAGCSLSKIFELPPMLPTISYHYTSATTLNARIFFTVDLKVSDPRLS